MADTELIFESTVEGLFKRSLKDRLTPSVMEQIRAAGIDLTRPLQPAYSRELYASCVRIAAQALYAELPMDEALLQIGLDTGRGFEQTLLGKALVATLRLLGPKRTLARMTQNFRSANNYTESRLTELAPNRYELWLNQTNGMPTYYKGILLLALGASGAKGCTVDHAPAPDGSCTFQLRWS